MRYKRVLDVGINTKSASNKYHVEATPVLRFLKPALRLIRLLWWVFRCL